MIIRLFALLLTFVSVNFASIIMMEFASPAPNAFGSPSFNTWVTNAINALQNGLTSVGNPATDPAAYYQVTQENDMQNIVTGFPSWLGLANPGTAFGPAFANELGNRLHFGLVILGTGGTTFSLSNLSFNMHSSDPGNTFSFVGSFGPTDSYSARRVGIDINNNVINSGPATQVVKELIYVGVGNAIAPDASCPGSTQATLDCVKAFYDSIMPFTLTTDYTLQDGTGATIGTSTASVLFTDVPEPATLGFLLAGSLALLLKRKLR